MGTAVVCRSWTANARNLKVRSLNIVMLHASCIKLQVIPRRSDSRGYRVDRLLRGRDKRSNKMKTR